MITKMITYGRNTKMQLVPASRTKVDATFEKVSNKANSLNRKQVGFHLLGLIVWILSFFFS